MQTLNNVASYILNKYKGEITPMKLQKLLYYIKVWSLVGGQNLFPKNDSFHAWKFGPVNKSIYHKYKEYGSKPIPESPNYEYIQENEKHFIDFILESYMPYNAITLSKTTHSEDPWINKSDSVFDKISDKDIIDYYSKESFAKNFPLGTNNKYYPPKTNSHYAFVFDMDEDDEAAEITFDSIQDYKEKFQEASSKAPF
ncbi:DUF4065 domain-containing protein [Aliifodinibius sp. S!AR15-10]|uniref:Panacea domain-containing protein n=1 Tax=Aliifodinibius sp. S!AR15-10 TaxID=2950437 RepID=UPI00286041EF|nr:type II toxin-antitoxin system antitoxin SocA domain-containing protein [Aliifodinibius sp. S!AR15-10]MDR8392086.1 DUF4065 domain-containing protein [Aliifodinibius sp. S!AR15-10]